MAEYRQKVDYQFFRREEHRPKVSGLPLWSVVIVGYGTGNDLLDCLSSVFRQHQSDFEVILVDNGNNEAITPDLKQYPLLRIEPPQNMLWSEGRNIGAHFSRGKYLAFVDDDGIVLENYLLEGEKALAQPKVVGARGRIMPKTEGGATSAHYDLGGEPKNEEFNVEGNMVIHRDRFLEVNGFDPLMAGHEGKELGLRLDKACQKYKKIYWPTLELKHNFAKGTKLEAKRKRQAVGINYIKYIASSAEINTRIHPTNCRVGAEMVIKDGISIIIRAGSNQKEANKFLRQFTAINTFKPSEIFVLLSKPASESLELVTEFSTKARIAALTTGEKTIADIAEKARQGTLLLISTPAEIKNDCLNDMWKLFNSSKDTLLNAPVSNLSNSVMVSRETALTLASTPIYATEREIKIALSQTSNSEVVKAESLKHWQIQREVAGVPLDTQIEVLEAELKKNDDDLTTLYSKIEKLDRHYDTLPSNATDTNQLKEKIKAVIEDSNTRLKELKIMHNQLEYLRIRKYSLSV